jgi:hypothetical protein
MEINEAVSLAGSIVESVKSAKKVCDAIPQWLFFPPLKAQVSELKSQITLLERQVNYGFPKLEQLISSYSYLVSEVKVAKALSDKSFEILGLVSDAHRFMENAAIDRENECSRIKDAIARLPSIDSAEAGELSRIMTSIRDKTLELKRLGDNDALLARRLHGEISTQYSDMSSIISKLLDKILVSFKLSS